MFIGAGVQLSGGVQVLSDIPSTVPIVTSGLQVNLASAPASGTTWTDTSGNGRNATLQGTPTYVSNNGGGIRLNNASYTGTDHISVPFNIATTTATVEIVASFNPTAYWATIWGNENYNAGSGHMAFMNSSTTINWGRTGSISSSITASNSIRHWTFVINGSSGLLYLNGSQLGATGSLGTAQSSYVTTEFLFGARHTNAGTGATDKLNNSSSSNYPVFYQMRIYNTALSAGDVLQNYNAVRGTYGI
jgi:hypothetical protein